MDLARAGDLCSLIFCFVLVGHCFSMCFKTQRQGKNIPDQIF